MPHHDRHTWTASSHRGIVVVATAVVAILIAGCGFGSGGQAMEGASATPIRPALTFPPSQTPIEPGTYRWDGFDRPVSVALGPGWQLGHDNPAFFDLFRGSDFPAVSFARFTDVYADRAHRVVADDVVSVETSLLERTDLALTGVTPTTLGGLEGWQFDLATQEARTPLFFGPAGDFQLDPEFKTRYRVLDFPGGGVLVVGIHSRVDAFDAGVALGEPVVATLVVEP